MLIKYNILKHILLKYFRNATTHINITGIISSTIILENTKIALDKKKIFLSNIDIVLKNKIDQKMIS